MSEVQSHGVTLTANVKYTQGMRKLGCLYSCPHQPLVEGCPQKFLSKEVFVAQLCLTLCDPIDCSLPDSSVHGIFPGKNTGVDCHSLLQGIFLIQGSNLDLLHCKHLLYHLSHHFLGTFNPPTGKKTMLQRERSQAQGCRGWWLEMGGMARHRWIYHHATTGCSSCPHHPSSCLHHRRGENQYQIPTTLYTHCVCHNI